ncbi:related to na h-exchanging protein [Ceraceosorus bombacis]|uniref:Related to na h-exchanging protein n=1 Tax=Ceraceosorus bombacis TaxID=401625 RepID=A0A0P1BJ00_9BASI|nr:related to na h-exchanging protein [Ceraceosorus bombacis]
MAVHVVETDVSNVSIAFAVLGGFIVIYGLGSYVVKEKLYLSEALVATTVGIIVGPYVLNWFDPYSWSSSAERTNEITYQFTRLVIGVQVLFAGISLPAAYLRKEVLSLFTLLGGVMTVAWFVTAGILYALFRPLSYLEALCLAAAVTPTDPVLANSISSGRYAEKHVPQAIRNIIVAESGANDGLGFPFLYLALYLLRRTSVDSGGSIGDEIWRWFYSVVIYQILLSCVYGALLGYLGRKTLRWAEAHGYVDKDTFFAYGLGLALFVLGTTGLFGSDDVLACFIAGNSFTWNDWYRIRTREQEMDSWQDNIDALFSTSAFIYIGAIIPWGDYSTGGSSLGIDPWRVVVMAIAVLLVRRLPAVLAMYKIIPAVSELKEALFLGWFGPIGVSAVFYITIALKQLPDDGSRDRLRALYTPLTLFMVFASVLTHGTCIPLAKLGPRIVKRTMSVTKTASRPVSRQPTVAETLNARRQREIEEKQEQAPAHEQDTSQGSPGTLEQAGESTSEASDATENGQHQQQSQAPSRLAHPTPDLTLPISRPASATLAAEASTSADAQHVNVPHTWYARAEAALQRELAAEQAEASKETSNGWLRQGLVAEADANHDSETASGAAPSTPGRVRFD